MCPFCISNLALLAMGAVSTGGVTALIAGKVRAKSKAAEISNNFKRRIKSRVRPAQYHHGSTENSGNRPQLSKSAKIQTAV